MKSIHDTPTNKSIVAKSNPLIPKLGKLSLVELRLLAYCLSCYDSRSTQNRTIYILVKDFKDFYEMSSKTAYATIRDIKRQLDQKPIQIRTEDGWLDEVQWFSRFGYNEGEGRFRFSIAPELEPYLLGLKDSFTALRLGLLKEFKTSYGWKLYANLKRWEYRGLWSVSITDLRDCLGIEEGRYSEWWRLNDKALKPALKEIEKKSDLDVTVSYRRELRRVVSLTFQIRRKAPDGTIDIETPQSTVYGFLMDSGLKPSKALKLTSDAEWNEKLEVLARKLPAIKARWEKEKKGPLAAYVTRAAEYEVYQPDLPGFQEEPAQPTERPPSEIPTTRTESISRSRGFSSMTDTEKAQRKAESERRNRLFKEAAECHKLGYCHPGEEEKCSVCPHREEKIAQNSKPDHSSKAPEAPMETFGSLMEDVMDVLKNDKGEVDPNAMEGFRSLLGALGRNKNKD